MNRLAVVTNMAKFNFQQGDNARETATLRDNYVLKGVVFQIMLNTCKLYLLVEVDTVSNI